MNGGAVGVRNRTRARGPRSTLVEAIAVVPRQVMPELMADGGALNGFGQTDARKNNTSGCSAASCPRIPFLSCGLHLFWGLGGDVLYLRVLVGVNSAHGSGVRDGPFSGRAGAVHVR
jgi:hypothetical protein